MSYWQMDDKFLGHHKTKRAMRKGAEALQMWVAMRSYVANNESDGLIPDGDIDDLPGAPESPRKWLKILVGCGTPAIGMKPQGAGLVDALPGCWKLHNYEKRGLLRAQIEAKREADRVRKERWKERQDGTHPERRSDSVPNASVTSSGTRPRVRTPAGALPSHPIPSQDHTHTSELVEPTQEHRKLAGELGVDAAAEFGRFRAHARGKGRDMVDEAACFELWLRDEAKKPKRAEPRAASRGGPSAPSDDELRRARNRALEDAEAGRYGPAAREKAKTLRGSELTELADLLAQKPPPPLRLAADVG